MENNKYINAMRSLAIQAIEKAGQGHTGMAISACPITYTLFTKFINISKKDSKWINRDRFVLSAGHGSMSYYSALHFGGFISLNEIKNHKQKGSQTPGHPEYEHKNFIDCSTGPLGQGVAMAVGMAIAEAYLNKRFYKEKWLINHYTYVVVGDGCIQEGISYEAMSLAGRLGLKKLIMIHDSNDNQLDTKVNNVFNENLKKRMESMNWDYIKTSNDPKEIEKAIRIAQKNSKPTFIEVKTIIGEGTSAANSNKAHGLKITDKEISLFEQHFDTKIDNFKFDKSIYDYFEKSMQQRGINKHNEWLAKVQLLKTNNPKIYKEFKSIEKGNFIDILQFLDEKQIKSNQATRDYVGEYIQQLAKKDIWDTMIGSADLAGPTKLTYDTSKNFNDDKSCNEILYGIREFAMSGIQNGILLHGGLRSICSTFLAFADYMKSSIRLGAMMKLPSNYIFSHDSYQVGGDGPTHQPYDQLPMLRAIENVYVYRPCNEIETKYVINKLFKSENETNIGVFTRQPLVSKYQSKQSKLIKGGYIVIEDKDPDITICASGSEVSLAVDVKEKLNAMKIKVKVVSMLCLQKFFSNDLKYINETLRSKKGIFSLEASADYYWYRLSNYAKKYYHFGAYTFGESMDGTQLYKEKGFSEENIIKLIKENIL